MKMDRDEDLDIANPQNRLDDDKEQKKRKSQTRQAGDRCRRKFQSVHVSWGEVLPVCEDCLETRFLSAKDRLLELHYYPIARLLCSLSYVDRCKGGD